MTEKNKDRISRACFSIFPSPESFQEFKETVEGDEDCEQTVQKFIRHAYKHELIRENSEKAFVEFITESPKDIQPSSLEGTSITYIIDQVIKQLPSIKNEKELADKLNTLAEDFGMPSINPTKLSRLKIHFDTPKRLLALRIFAYFIARELPHLNWHYDKFFKLPEAREKTVDPYNGIELAFTIQVRDNILEPAVIKWVKKELEGCLSKHRKRIEELGLSTEHMGDKNENIKSEVIVTRLTLLRKLDITSESDLHTYVPAIRDALAISHEMAVHWLISPHSSPHSTMITALYAGKLSLSDTFFRQIFKVEFTEPSLILLNNFGYECAQVAGSKVAFERPQRPIKQGDGGLLMPWFVEYVWHQPYFNFASRLLEEFPKDKSEEYYQSKILALREKFPHNPLLLMEIVKILMSRGNYALADKALNDILALDKSHLLGRICRMFCYENLAADFQERSDFIGAEFAFERALAESKFFLNDCMEPEGFTATGNVLYAHASSQLELMITQKRDFGGLQEKTLFYLERSCELFLRAVSLASDGKDIRALALYTRSQALLEQIKRAEDPKHLLEPNFWSGSCDCYYPIAISLFKLVRLLSMDFPGYVDEKTLRFEDGEEKESIKTKEKRIMAYVEFIERILAMNDHFQQSVLSRTFTPNTRYFWGCFLWDFAPVMTKSLYYIIWKSFQAALAMALKLKDEGFLIHSLSSAYSQDTSKFISIINKSIELIEKIIPDKEFQEGEELLKFYLNRKGKGVEEVLEAFAQDLLDEDTTMKVSKEKLMIFQFEFLLNRKHSQK